MKHKCERCGRSFARWEHLSRHERSHTKEKPFSCNSCPQAFTRKDLLTRHTRIHHASSSKSTARDEDAPGRLARPRPHVASSANDGPSHEHQTLLNGTVTESTTQRAGSFLLSDLGYAAPTNSTDAILSQDLNGMSETLHDDVDFCSPSFPVDFSAYLDTFDHPTGPFSSVYQPLPFYVSPELVTDRDMVAKFSTFGSWPTRNSNLNDAAQFSQSNLTSRAPSAQPPACNRHRAAGVDESGVFDPQYKVDEPCRKAIVTKLQPFQQILPSDYKLPTKHTLNRFVHGWLTIFNDHYPMIHIPSLCLSEMPVELFLAITSLGAQYCYEREKGLPLFNMSRDIALERLRRRPKIDTLLTAESAESGVNSLVQTAQALTILIATSMWSQSDPSIRDALFLRSSLLALLQDDTLDTSRSIHPSISGDWSAWIRYETAKRTKLVAFAILNLFTIAFDMPPVVLYREMKLVMPCDERTWTAKISEDMIDGIDPTSTENLVTDVVDTLFAAHHGSDFPLGHPTSLGNYAIIHALIQHVWIFHHSGNMITGTRNGNGPAPSIEEALRAWQEFYWKHDQTSSNIPTKPGGPLTFTSLALLRLAYIRLTTKSSFTNYLNIWDPDKIGQALYQAPQVQRSDKASRVALHCAQAIALPIKTGLNFVAYTQVFYWSNQYALCSFECALLLSKWLEVITKKDLDPPRSRKEDKVLDFIIQLMAETEYDMSRDELLRGRTLSILVVRLWSRLFRRDHVWELVSIIGMSLEAYASNLERQM